MTSHPQPITSTLECAVAPFTAGGTLLHGPAGCGKTELARALAGRVSCAVQFLDTRRIRCWRTGGAEVALRSELCKARAAAPCVLVIDELPAIAPAGARPGSPESRLALQLAEGIQQLRIAAVFTLGICREADSVHAAVRRSGRLHHELAVRAPTPAQRSAILEALAHKLLPAAITSAGRRLRHVVRSVGGEAHGLCGAQLAGLCQHAAMAAWRVGHGSPGAGAPYADSASGSGVTLVPPDEAGWCAALEAARSTALSALRLSSTVDNSPTGPPLTTLPVKSDAAEAAAEATRIADGAGDHHTRAGHESSPPPPPAVRSAASATALEALARLPAGEALLASLIAPLCSPSTFKRLGVRPPRGVLMYGGPGVGKTTLARHIAAASSASFVEVHAAQLVSPIIGASEAALARLFTSARAAAPCILFLDGVDALAPQRGADSSTEGTMDRLLSLLLTEVDGALQWEGPPVVLLGATRQRALLDPAILRPGRLDVHLSVGAPDDSQRGHLLEHLLARTPVDWAASDGGASDGVSLAWLAQRSAGFTLAQLSALTREAAMNALRESIDVERVRFAHFEKAAAALLR